MLKYVVFQYMFEAILITLRLIDIVHFVFHQCK